MIPMQLPAYDFQSKTQYQYKLSRQGFNPLAITGKSDRAL